MTEGAPGGRRYPNPLSEIHAIASSPALGYAMPMLESSQSGYDPEERAREKRASRDADAAALASGEKTREQLWMENSFLPPGGVVDWTKV